MAKKQTDNDTPDTPENDNMALWSAVARPPKEALKQIIGGRLKGKSDINPQWRMKAMTEQFGPCGEGWKYTIDRLWLEPAPNDQVFAFALVSLYVRHSEAWSDAIPGIGGSMLIEDERNGKHANDEAYKMAVTDALSVALKALGVAADIYAGLWDGSKYLATPTAPADPQAEPRKPEPTGDGTHVIATTLGEVRTKTGQSAKGEWTRYYSKASDGEFYSTFSNTVGETMIELTGQPVVMTFVLEQTAKGESRTVKDVYAAEPDGDLGRKAQKEDDTPDPETAPFNDNDNIPF